MCILSRTTPPAQNVPSTPCHGWGKSRMFQTTMVDGNWTGTNITWKGGWPVETPKGWWGSRSPPVTARSMIHLPEVTLTSEVTRVRSVCLFFNLFHLLSLLICVVVGGGRRKKTRLTDFNVCLYVTFWPSLIVVFPFLMIRGPGFNKLELSLLLNLVNEMHNSIYMYLY